MTDPWRAAFETLDQPVLLASRAADDGEALVIAVSRGLSIACGVSADTLIGTPLAAWLAEDHDHAAAAAAAPGGDAMDEKHRVGFRGAGGSVLPADLVALGGDRGWLLRLRDGAGVGSDDSPGAPPDIYRYLVENHPAMICRFLPDTTLTFVNAAYAGFFGVRAEHLIGRRFVDLLGPADRDPVLAHLAAISPESPSRHIEHVVRDASGVERWHLWEDYGFFDAAGDARYFLSLGTDVTARRTTEQKLAESEARLQRIANALPARIAYLDRDCVYRFVNHGYERDFGRPTSEIVGMHARDLLGEDVFRDIVPYIEDALAGREVRYEYVLGTPSGTRRNEVTYTPEVAGDGTVGGFYVLVVDVTARHENERALRESQDLLKNAERIAHFGSWSWDIGTDRCAWSDEHFRIFGYQPGAIEPTARLVMDAVHPADRARVKAAAAAALAGTSPFDVEFRIVRPDGSVRLVSDRGEVMRDAAGRPQRIVGSVLDITDRKLSEDALFAEKERAEVTLHAIGDAVISTDADGRIDYLNPVAEWLTGWTLKEAHGRALLDVMHIVDEQTGEAALDSVAQCLTTAAPTAPLRPVYLVSRRGIDYPIDMIASPIRARAGGLIGAVLVFRDVTETRRRTRQLVHEASHDPLTGLVNRREFDRRLERAVASARAHGWNHAVCFLDLDAFKGVNDAAGHAAGDALLAQIRGLFIGKFRERDTFARLGGDEFALLLDACALEEAIKIAETIVATIRDHRFVWKDRNYSIGVSVGVVPIGPDSQDATQVLTRADLACYAAKQAGGNRVHYVRSGAAEVSSGHGEVLLAARLQTALEERRFQLMCQPMVVLSARPGTADLWEVLLRLVESDGDLVGPDAFISAADRFGLMGAIDRWVIDTAIAFLATDLRARPAVGLAINLSSNSINDSGMADYVDSRLDRYGIAPHRLCFEFAETLTARNVGNAATLARDLKALGARVALDDFGAGLSSFAHLKALPADFLKIDGSFVRDMLDSPVDAAFVAAAQTAGRTMGIETVGEYAHTAAVVDRLRELGVDRAQGYAFGEPQPLDVIGDDLAMVPFTS